MLSQTCDPLARMRGRGQLLGLVPSNNENHKADDSASCPSFQGQVTTGRDNPPGDHAPHCPSRPSLTFHKVSHTFLSRALETWAVNRTGYCSWLLGEPTGQGAWTVECVGCSDLYFTAACAESCDSEAGRASSFSSVPPYLS